MKGFCGLAICALATLCALSGCMTTLDREPIRVAERVQGREGVDFLARDEKWVFAGGVSPDGLRRLSEEGVVNVISLRTEEELLSLGYNEPALARQLGLKHFALPMTVSAFSVSHVDRLADVLKPLRTTTLIQGPDADRVGMLWGAYLVRERGYSLGDAESRARAAGLSTNDALLAMRRIATEGR